jgi:hypothetical protein
MSPEWILQCVLPNLELQEFIEGNAEGGGGGVWSQGITLNTEDVVLVPSNEPRARAAAASSSAADALLHNFRDAQGVLVRPAALLVRKSAPELLRHHWEPLTCFRNAVALSFLLKGRAGSSDGGFQPTWSDTFDIYPVVPDARGTLSTFTPALNSMGLRPERFSGSPAPHMPRVGRRMFADRTLYRLLGMEWARRFGAGAVDDADVDSRALWRSIEHAYYALSAAVRHEGSIHDYGIQVGHWVAALEILAWPLHRKANVTRVLELLGEFEWRGPLGTAPRTARVIRGTLMELNTVQLLYVHLNVARNNFLHGEPVSNAIFYTHLEEPRVAPTPRPTSEAAEEPQRSLVNLASLVYRTALVAFLRRRHPDITDDTSTEVLVSAVFDDWDYHRALETMLPDYDFSDDDDS